MNYKVVNQEGVFDISEVPSGMKIKLEADHLKAEKICKKLNSGTGFNGFTPPFFAEFKGLTF